jgi:hypothetical protein
MSRTYHKTTRVGSFSFLSFGYETDDESKPKEKNDSGDNACEALETNSDYV